MKSILLFSLLLCFYGGFSQTIITIEGQVRDRSSDEPLAYVNIHLTGTNLGTVTNQTGYFVFKYSSSDKDDSIVFSHLGYKPFQVHVNDSTRVLMVFLEPHPVQLDEIIVKPLNPLDIVYTCVSNFSRNYNITPHNVQGFQREYVKQSEKYIQLMEVTFETKLLRQNYAQISNVLDARYIEHKREKAPLWSTSRGGFYTFGWTTISGIENPSSGNFLGLNVKSKRDLAQYYEFKVRDPIMDGDKELHVVDFDQRKNVNRPLLKGTLVIDPDSYALVKVTYQLSPRGIRHLKSNETFGGIVLSKRPKKIDIKKESCEVTYRIFGNKWYLNTLVVDTEFDAALVFFRMLQSQKTSLKLHSERVVTAIDTTGASDYVNRSNINDVGSVPTLQNFIKQHFENYDELNEEKWADVNFIRSDTSIALIAKQLYKENEQWELSRQRELNESAMAKRLYTSKQLLEDLNFLKETLEEVHPGLHWYTNKNQMDREFELIERKLKKGMTEVEFFQLLSPLVEKIHCGHTEIMPSSLKSEYLRIYAKAFPLDIWINGDSCFVKNTRENIFKGTRVLAINGNEVSEIITRIKMQTPSDGFNLSYKEFLLNNNFSSLYSMYFPVKDTFEVKIQDLNGVIKVVKLLGETGKREQLKEPGLATLSVIDSPTTALLTIPSFSDTNQDFSRFLEQSFEQIEADSIKNLVIDLRNNEGGRDEYGLLLFSYLFNVQFKYYEYIKVATTDTSFLNRLNFGDLPFDSAIPDYTSNIQEINGSLFYTKHTNLGIHRPKERTFSGQVYILVNGGTFSTAAEFASLMYNHKRAVFIGEKVGGGYYGNCSLGTPTLMLPNSKIRISIPLAKYKLAVDRTIPEGHSLTPDYRTKNTLKNILENKDKDLEVCLKVIAEN